MKMYMKLDTSKNVTIKKITDKRVLTTHYKKTDEKGLYCIYSKSQSIKLFSNTITGYIHQLELQGYKKILS